MRNVTLAPPHLAMSATDPLTQAAWIALSLAISLASWKLARRLSGQS